ncbi:ribosomal protection-like ABC-F family protein [Candidatus Stoquefichus massiliensis]|uniref:ribosomal protection-like ABC-F family protein n=1 Tax=Candidatus Stoquefichus massiliensis TaxID=1470350 RepID=UPI000482980A|nr:ABC-F type ribosomal protection protein [Candidatus Stoquefichus massiliensis]
MAVIQVKHLSFYYEGNYDFIFNDVSFSFDTEYKTALIGRNARGKTTFLKLLMNQYKYQGEIIKSVSCEYFPYEVKDESLYTIDICLDIAPYIQQWELVKEFHLLNMDSDDIMYRPFHTLSQGERTKVLLAVLFLKKNTFLLLDEPTNHLDQPSRKIVAEYLNKQKGFLLVSHDRAFIDGCCHRIIAINPTSIEVVNGNFTSWYENKQKKDMSEIQYNKHLKRDIHRLEESRKKTKQWSDKVEKSKNAHGHRDAMVKPDKGYIGHMAAKMMKRSKNIETRKNLAIEEKKTLFKDIEVYDDLKMITLSYFQSILLNFYDFSLSYDQKTIFRHLTFSVENGDRILLKGKNGCGKSSLLSFILGKKIMYQGNYEKGSCLKISYVPQDCSSLSGYLDDLIDAQHADKTLVFTILRKLDFSHIHLKKRIEQLSEGQKKKIMLALSLSSSAHLYIWDEPLNYIDVFSRIQIEKLILEYKPTLLFVEHDQFFQEKIATKIIDFNELV